MRLSTCLAASLLAATALAAIPAAAQHADHTSASVDAAALESVLAHPRREADRARDQYRHPAETLEFFRVEPTMRVAEYAPAGGWFTRVLLPYLAPEGSYIAFQRGRPAAEDGTTWPQRFLASLEGGDMAGYGTPLAVESNAIPEDVAGTVDRVLIFRSLHGLLNNNVADEELRAIRTLLADDGMVGVEQHRAPEDETYARANGSRGYLRQSDVIRLFELNGFELVESSEVNANPADTADWEGGVWTLPPTLSQGEADRDRYLAIGESDRMTLLFRKRP